MITSNVLPSPSATLQVRRTRPGDVQDPQGLRHEGVWWQEAWGTGGLWLGYWGPVGCGALGRRQEVRVRRGREESGGGYQGGEES